MLAQDQDRLAAQESDGGSGNLISDLSRLQRPANPFQAQNIFVLFYFGWLVDRSAVLFSSLSVWGGGKPARDPYGPRSLDICLLLTSENGVRICAHLGWIGSVKVVFEESIVVSFWITFDITHIWHRQALELWPLPLC
jgi:hypothetical protein